MSRYRWPSVSVIIVGYNSRLYLASCLDALLAQCYLGEREVIFVDNASLDDSAAFIGEQYPSVRVIANNVNLGYAVGNNLGACQAHGDVLVFLNPDTQVRRAWLTELISPLRLDAAIGLTTSKIVYMDRPHVINACGNDVSYAGVASCRHGGDLAVDVVDDIDVPAVSGASFAIRSGLFRQLGGFDARFFMYVEDTDLSWRARMLGYRCRLAAGSIVAHDYVFQLSPLKTEHLERNRYQMLLKNLSLSSFLLLLPTLIVSEIVNWGGALLQGPRHLWAKVLALCWIVEHWGEIQTARRLVQASRVSTDRHIMRDHHVAPPILAVVGGFAGKAISAVVTPIVIVAALPVIVLFAILPTPAINGALPEGMVEESQVGD